MSKASLLPSIFALAGVDTLRSSFQPGRHVVVGGAGGPMGVRRVEPRRGAGGRGPVGCGCVRRALAGAPGESRGERRPAGGGDRGGPRAIGARGGDRIGIGPGAPGGPLSPGTPAALGRPRRTRQPWPERARSCSEASGRTALPVRSSSSRWAYPWKESSRDVHQQEHPRSRRRPRPLVLGAPRLRIRAVGPGPGRQAGLREAREDKRARAEAPGSPPVWPPPATRTISTRISATVLEVLVEEEGAKVARPAPGRLSADDVRGQLVAAETALGRDGLRKRIAELVAARAATPVELEGAQAHAPRPRPPSPARR